MRNVKVAIVESKNPLTDEAHYSVVGGDIEVLKYSPACKIVELPENEVAEIFKKQKEFIEMQFKIQAKFYKDKK